MIECYQITSPGLKNDYYFETIHEAFVFLEESLSSGSKYTIQLVSVPKTEYDAMEDV